MKKVLSVLLVCVLVLAVFTACSKKTQEGATTTTAAAADGCRTDFADIQNKKECGGNRQWQRQFLRKWAANTKGKAII